MKVQLNLYWEGVVSDCHNAPVYEDSNLCSTCGLPCIAVCEECLGSGDIPDRRFQPSNPNIIDQPFIKCPNCGGGKL